MGLKENQIPCSVCGPKVKRSSGRRPSFERNGHVVWSGVGSRLATVRGASTERTIKQPSRKSLLKEIFYIGSDRQDRLSPQIIPLTKVRRTKCQRVSRWVSTKTVIKSILGVTSWRIWLRLTVNVKSHPEMGPTVGSTRLYYVFSNRQLFVLVSLLSKL